MHNLIFVSKFTNFRSTEKFSFSFELKWKIKKTTVITKGKLLIYQLVKIIVFYIMVFNDLSITFWCISEGL